MVSRKFRVWKHFDVDGLNGTFNQYFQNLTELSNEERESIIRVLKRDAELNDLESERVFRLKRILKDFKRRGIGKDRVSVKLDEPTSFSYLNHTWHIWYEMIMVAKDIYQGKNSKLWRIKKSVIVRMRKSLFPRCSRCSKLLFTTYQRCERCNHIVCTNCIKGIWFSVDSNRVFIFYFS